MDQKELTAKIIGAAIEVHRELGPGLLESSYESALQHELTLRGFKVTRQLLLPIKYKNLEIPDAYRIDLLVEDQIILEIKAVEVLKPIHNAQLLTYLRMSGKHIGYLLNFHEDVLTKGGLRRFVHYLKE